MNSKNIYKFIISNCIILVILIILNLVVYLKYDYEYFKRKDGEFNYMQMSLGDKLIYYSIY